MDQSSIIYLIDIWVGWNPSYFPNVPGAPCLTLDARGVNWGVHPTPWTATELKYHWISYTCEEREFQNSSQTIQGTVLYQNSRVSFLSKMALSRRCSGGSIKQAVHPWTPTPYSYFHSILETITHLVILRVLPFTPERLRSLAVLYLESDLHLRTKRNLPFTPWKPTQSCGFDI